jgi:hypothetical protein
MEDSTVSKRAVRQAGSEKSSVGANRLQGPPALVASAVWVVASEVRLLKVSVACGLLPTMPGVVYAGRAPPRSLLV